MSAHEGWRKIEVVPLLNRDRMVILSNANVALCMKITAPSVQFAHIIGVHTFAHWRQLPETRAIASVDGTQQDRDLFAEHPIARTISGKICALLLDTAPVKEELASDYRCGPLEVLVAPLRLKVDESWKFKGLVDLGSDNDFPDRGPIAIPLGAIYTRNER